MYIIWQTFVWLKMYYIEFGFCHGLRILQFWKYFNIKNQNFPRALNHLNQRKNTSPLTNFNCYYSQPYQFNIPVCHQIWREFYKMCNCLEALLLWYNLYSFCWTAAFQLQISLSHCTMCSLYSFFSIRPSEVRHVVKFHGYIAIKHIFILARSVEWKIEKIRVW